MFKRQNRDAKEHEYKDKFVDNNTNYPEVRRIDTITTPTLDILSTPESLSGETIYSGEGIAQNLTLFGVPCCCMNTVSAPQVVTYHFDLDNLFDINKLSKPVNMLRAVYHVDIRQIKSDKYNFALQFTKNIPYTVYFKQAISVINGCSGTSALLGVDENAQMLKVDIAKCPHLLIAGETGSGKSVLLNSIICSLLFKSPDNRFVMIDPKRTELSRYEGIFPLFRPIVKDPCSAIEALESVCKEMDNRYNNMERAGTKDYKDIGCKPIIVVIDELADLMLTSHYKSEQFIVRIAQLGRAAGIHLIIATQRPTAQVLTGLIKSNMPCRIALQTASIRDSINILDHKGAEQLIGRGDALLKLPDRVNTIRFQSAYISDSDIDATADYWRDPTRYITATKYVS